MDAPVTRSKQQVINFYSSVLSEECDFTQSQEDVVRAALAFACSEMEDRYAAAYAKLHDQWVDANNELVRLKEANTDAEEEIGRLCTELQTLQAKPVATIQMNGTAPTQAPDEPPAIPQQMEPFAAAPRRGGRKPGTKNKPKETPKVTLDEIAKQIEVGTPGRMAAIDRSLIGDDPNDFTLKGTLRREESHVTTQHGIPVKVTRQYIEIR